MRNRHLVTVSIAGFIEEVPGDDARIGGVFPDDLRDHGVEAFRGLRLVQDRIVTDAAIWAMGGVLPAAVVAPVVVLRSQLGRTVVFVPRDGAVVGEADQQRNAVPGGDREKPLEPLEKSVVLLIPDDELQNHPDRIESDRRRQSEFPVGGGQMLFKIQLLPEGDPVAAV